jgi:hypothetical protein
VSGGESKSLGLGNDDFTQLLVIDGFKQMGQPLGVMFSQPFTDIGQFNAGGPTRFFAEFTRPVGSRFN